MKKAGSLPRRRICAMLVLLLLLVSLLPACAGSGPSAGDYKVEDNPGDNRTTYPYLVHTPSATWYLAADDIALLGEDAFFDGLAAILKNQEQDFADARSALAGYISEEIPIIDIYTDFCGNAAISEMASAYYSESSNLIKVFSGWDSVGATLLHEYVHYLTLHCAPQPATHGFYAEAAANYFSMIACKSRMAQSVNYGLPEDQLEIVKAGGAWDEAEGCLDMEKLYFGTAHAFAQGWSVGAEFFSVSDIMELRTEELQQDPSVYHVSHFEAACILAYLIETYSLETVMENLDTDPADMESVFGESFSQIYQKWTVWNAARCEELGLVFG